MKTTDSLERYRAILKERNYRITPVMTMIIFIMSETKAVRSAQEIKDAVSRQLCTSAGFPTVYRVLQKLHDCGILCSMHNPDGIMRYYICENPQNHHHHHFICTNCQKVQEINTCTFDKIEKFVTEEMHAVVQKHFFQIEGLCCKCIAESSDTMK